MSTIKNTNVVKGDICSISSGILVHGCNAQGVMNSGIARQIRQMFPEAFDAYRKKYEMSGLVVGDVVFCPPTDTRAFWIANAITQKFYGRNPNVRYVDYDGIKKSFDKIATLAQKENLEIHFPQIGAGLGNGKWEDILPIIENSLQNCSRTLWIYAPTSKPSTKQSQP